MGLLLVLPGLGLWLARSPRSGPRQNLQHLQGHGHLAECGKPQCGGHSQQGETLGTRTVWCDWIRQLGALSGSRFGLRLAVLPPKTDELDAASV